MVRYAACRTLGGSASSRGRSTACRTCLGDESKVVRRAAAEAIAVDRQPAERLEPGPGETEAQRRLVDASARRSRSPDDRTRRGATRVFAAHFRELSQELALADACSERLDDPDPVVAMQAIKGLWRWWYWRPDPSLAESDRRPADRRPGRAATPWVRRNLIEALYIIGDENIRYLDKNWIPSLARAEDRRPADRGAARDGEPPGGQVRRRPGGGQPAPARGRAPRDVGVLRAAGAGRPDRQRPGADALPRGDVDQGRGGPDRADVRPRPDDPPAGASRPW